MVGTGRFELPTPRTPSECSTRLSHVPTRKEPAASHPQRMGLTREFYHQPRSFRAVGSDFLNRSPIDHEGARRKSSDLKPSCYFVSLVVDEFRTPSGMRSPFLASRLLRRRSGRRHWPRFFQNSELDLFLHGIDAVNQHANSLSQVVSLARVPADDLARILVIRVVIVGERVQRHQAFHEQIRQLDEE